MGGLDLVSTNPKDYSHPQVPGAEEQFNKHLRDIVATFETATGPGGTNAALPRDRLIGPSQQGLRGPGGSLVTLSHHPEIYPPASDLDVDTQQAATGRAISWMVLSSIMPFVSTTTGTTPSSKNQTTEALQLVEGAVSQLLEEEGFPGREVDIQADQILSPGAARTLAAQATLLFSDTPETVKTALAGILTRAHIPAESISEDTTSALATALSSLTDEEKEPFNSVDNSTVQATLAQILQKNHITLTPAVTAALVDGIVEINTALATSVVHTVEGAAFRAWISDLQTSFSQPLPLLGSQATQISNALQSKDAPLILKTLLEMPGGLNSMTDLSPADRAKNLEVLTALSTSIATNPLTSYGVPFCIETDLRERANLPDFIPPREGESPLPVDLMLFNIAQTVSQVIAQQLSSREPNVPLFDNLNSTDSQAVLSVFNSIIESGSSVGGISSADITNLKQTLANLMSQQTEAGGDPDLQSVDMNSVKKALEKLLASGRVAVPQNIFTTILPILAQGIANINTEQMNVQLSSSDPKKVQQALEELSGIKTTVMPDAQRKVAVNYLKALTMALCFMAQIRGFITSMEGLMSQKLGQAQLQTLKDNILISTRLLDARTTEAFAKHDANCTQIRNAEFWRIFMPILSILIGLIALVLTIITVVTAGLAGPLLAGALILLISVIALSTATFVLSVVDSAMSMSTGKGLWAGMLEKAGCTDPLAQAAWETFINVLIGLVVIILTVGAAAISVALSLAKQAIEVTLKEVLKGILRALAQVMKTAVGMMIKMLLASTLFQSGLIYQAILKILDNIQGLDDTWKAVIASIINFFVMLAAMFITCKAVNAIMKAVEKAIAPAVAQQAAQVSKMVAEATVKAIAPQVAKATAKTTLSRIWESIKNFVKKIFSKSKQAAPAATQAAAAGTSIATTGAASAAQTAAQQAAQAVSKNFFSRIAQKFKEISMLQWTMLAKFLAKITEVIAQIIQGVQSINQAKIMTQVATLTFDAALLEAFLSLTQQFKELGPGTLIKSLSSDSEAMQKQFQDLCDKIAAFIMGASQFTTKLHQGA